MNNRLERTFNAQSIAIIGASKDSKKRGHQAVRQLLNDGYNGKIHPVHPSEPEILGLKAYPTILDVEGEIDSVLVCTPSKTLPEILEQCGRKNVSTAIVLAAGFSEIGDTGKSLADESKRIAGNQNVGIIGPNTNGIFNLHNKMNLVGLTNVKAGGIGICSQSGNMMLSFVNEAIRIGIDGFSTYAGVGNQIDVGLDEYLEYFGSDENTEVVVFYVEGFKNGPEFLKKCREVSQKKAVIVFKSGRTVAGQEAAISHTGSLASGYRLTKCLLKQAGAIVVDRSDMLAHVALGLAKLELPTGGRIAVLADGGGHATIMADSLIESGLELAELSTETSRKLQAILPQAASTSNPVDVAGGTDTTPLVNADCAEILLGDENVDMLVFTGMYGGFAERFDSSILDAEIETSARLIDLANRTCKPMIIQSIYSDKNPKPLDILKESSIPVFCWPEQAVHCIAESVCLSKARSRIKNSGYEEAIAFESKAENIIKVAIQGRRGILYEHESMDLLNCYGIGIQEFVIAKCESDLEQIPKLLGGAPVCMKIVSSDIPHKTDAGCVKLNVSGQSDILKAYQEILRNAEEFSPNCDLHGIKVSHMAGPGTEIVIGTSHDPTFGPVVMFGLGGIQVEILNDVTFRSIPISRADAREMILETSYPKLFGKSRFPFIKDRRKLEDLIVAVAQVAQVHPEISEIDLNPIILKEDGYTIVDARMILKTV